MTNWKYFKSTTTVPMGTKLDRVMTFEVPTYKVTHYHNSYSYQTWQGGNIPRGAPSHNVIWSLIKWSYEVTWQIKYALSPLALDQWIPNMTGEQLTVSGFTWSHEVKWQRKIIKSTISQCLWSPNLSNCKRLMRNFTVSSITILMASKLGKVVTYHEGLPLTASYDP